MGALVGGLSVDFLGFVFTPEGVVTVLAGALLAGIVVGMLGAALQAALDVL